MRLNWIHTIKFKIVALAVATGVLSTLATAELLLRVSHADIERLLMDNGASNLESTATLIANKLDLLNAILTAVARHTSPELWADEPALSRYLEDKPAAHAVFDTVLAADPSGQAVARFERGMPSAALPNIGDRPYFRRAIVSDHLVVSEPVFSRANGRPLVLLAMATPKRDGQATGVIVGSLALQSSRLFANLGQHDEDDGSRTLIMNRSGQLLVHPNPTRVLGNAADEPGLSAVFQRWREAGSPIGADASTTLSGDQLISLAGVPDSDWILVHMTPAASALKPLRTAKRTSWATAAAVGLMAALLAGWFALRVTRPIEKLRDRAMASLTDHRSNLAPWPEWSGEIGELARVFQHIEELREQRHDETQGLLLQLEAVLHNAETGIALTSNSKFQLVSRHFCETFGMEKGEMEGQSTRLIYGSDEAYAALAARARPQFMEQGFFAGEVELTRKSGATFWAFMRGRAVVPGDTTKGTIWTFDDVTEIRAQREKLTWASSHDALTGLANRPAFDTLLAEATEGASEDPFCAMFIDLDHFKQVNDTAGHAAGDAVLRDVAAALVAQVRKADTVARLGGDEFAILLAACPLQQAREIAEKIRQAIIDYRLDWDGATFNVGASIGLVYVDGTFTNAKEIMAAADNACYAAKRQGRNCVVVFGA